MKKFFFSLVAILILTLIIIFIAYDRFNASTILKNIEKKIGLNIKLLDKNTWIFFPILTYNNSNVTIVDKNNLLKVQNANIFISKNYWPLSPIYIDINAPVVNYKGMEMRNTTLKAKYSNNIIYVENLFGNIIEGSITLKGKFDFDEIQPFEFQGKFENISLETLLKQSQISNWDRVKIKLTSTNFKISGKRNENHEWLNSIKGTIPIYGSLYFVSDEEERFGAAFLSLLAEKIPGLTIVSQSIDFLLNNFSNIPSSINGTVKINDGLILSDDILIKNKTGKSTLKGSYNFLKNNIDGTFFLFKENKIFLEAYLKGDISNPQILVTQKALSKNENQPPLDIKQLLEKGINSFIEKLLSTYE